MDHQITAFGQICTACLLAACNSAQARITLTFKMLDFKDYDDHR
jgi:hypothetical protein